MNRRLKNWLERVKRLKPIVWFYRLKYSDSTFCRHCGLPWRVNGGEHGVQIPNTNMGFFCCCDYCWERMSRIEKMTAAASLYEWWLRQGFEPEVTLEEMYWAIAWEADGIKVERDGI